MKPVICKNRPARFAVIFILVLFLPTTIVSVAAEVVEAHGDNVEKQNIQLVRNVLEAYARLDWNAVADTFAVDGMLHSVMRDPFVGREVIRSRLIDFHEGIESMEIEVINIVAVGDVVMAERWDAWYMRGVKRQIPAVGVLEIEDGLIKEWREYYDLESLLRRLDPEFKGL